MLLVKDKNMKKLGILENAFNISPGLKVNEAWTLSFQLPRSDLKNNLCNHFNYIDVTGDSGTYYGLYRIMPTETKFSVDTDNIIYTCEHVFSTLLDDVIDGYLQIGGIKTADTINALLALQTTSNWVLGKCDFERYFEYSFENENGLLAPLLSIPASFGEAYEFTFDTNVYPWVLNLIRPSNVPQSEIRKYKDLAEFSKISDPSNIINYLIPKGAGEGVNQLSIASVNEGVKYIKDDDSITKWGRKSYIWVDKRYTDAQSLYENAIAMLKTYKEPVISTTVKSVDLSVLPEYANETKMLNSITNIIVDSEVYQARITGIKIPDLSEEWNKTYTINNKTKDISDAVTSIARKQQVMEAYSQGATNIINFQYMDNADDSHAATISFYVDNDVVNINTCELTFDTKGFRAYSQATEGGGASTQTSSSGGGTTATSNSGGGGTQTSSAGGSSTQTSSSGGGGTSGNTNINVLTSLEYPQYNNEGIVMGHAHYINVDHTHTISDHAHDVSIPDHTHNVDIPAHTHDVDIPSHTHDVSIPDHIHDVKQGIYELDSVPGNVTISVDGVAIEFSGNSADRLNLVDYLKKDDSGKIVRGKHTVEILPAGLARIEAFVILRVFISSQLGSVY